MTYRRFRWRIVPLLASAALLLCAPHAMAQQPDDAPQGPRSLLPDFATEPAPPPAGAPKSLLPGDLTPPPTPAPVAPAEPGPLPPLVVAPPAATPIQPIAPPPEPLDPFAELAGPTELPEQAGLLTQATNGYAGNLFLGSDARFLATLLRRIDAPLASRWAQIMLQRALLTRATPPEGLNPGDWVAARAMALVAMGSATDAHRMIERIAIDRYTQGLYSAAAESALASGDPIALCPLSTTARALTELPAWIMIDGMCAAIFGDDYGAAIQFDRVRGQNKVRSFDIGLAERIASAAGTGQSGANPAWDEISALTSWRIGLAAATGLEIPAKLIASATPTQRAWMARLPGISLESRAALAPEAAAFGVLSGAEVNRVMAAYAQTLSPSAANDSPGGQLRRASAADALDDRLSALSSLWGRARAGGAEHSGWRIATAAPAARIAVNATSAARAPELAEALVLGGLTSAAGRWWRIADDSNARARLWAALVAIDDNVPVSAALYREWAATVSPHRSRLLAAGLAGLGRGAVDQDIPAIENAWTQALDRAVAARHMGEVMIISATGLQGGWNRVHPDYLRRIAMALVAVGRAGEARMIVAEAAIRG